MDDDHPSSYRRFSSIFVRNALIFSSRHDMEVDLRTLLKEVFVIALLAALAMGLYAFVIYHRNESSPAPTATPIVTVTPVPISLHDDDSAWEATLTDPEALVEITDDPAFQKRFPAGVSVHLIDQLRAPEALRGDYDAYPFALRFGAVWPEPEPGQTIKPEMEAWADCVRDFELGPTNQLRCYLSLRGEPGDTLDRLASAALHQALSYALTGRVTPDQTWTSADAFLSLSPFSP